jgi:Penicillinase repressor
MTLVVEDGNGWTKINEARAPNHGGSVESGQGFHPGDSGNFSRKRQTSLYDDSDDRLSAGGKKKAVRHIKKVGNFHIFEAAVSRTAAQSKLIDDLLALFGGSSQPVMARLIETGKLTLADVKEAEKILRKLEGKDESK